MPGGKAWDRRVTYINDVSARFEDLDLEDVVAKLNKLQLNDDLSDYQDKLEVLEALMLGKNWYLFKINSYPFLVDSRKKFELKCKCSSHKSKQSVTLTESNQGFNSWFSSKDQ